MTLPQPCTIYSHSVTSTPTSNHASFSPPTPTHRYTRSHPCTHHGRCMQVLTLSPLLLTSHTRICGRKNVPSLHDLITWLVETNSERLGLGQRVHDCRILTRRFLPTSSFLFMFSACQKLSRVLLFVKRFAAATTNRCQFLWRRVKKLKDDFLWAFACPGWAWRVCCWHCREERASTSPVHATKEAKYWRKKLGQRKLSELSLHGTESQERLIVF